MPTRTTTPIPVPLIEVQKEAPQTPTPLDYSTGQRKKFSSNICMTPIPGQDCTEITPSFRVKGYYFRIDWFDVGVDVLGILGDIGFGTGTPPGIALEVIATGIEIIAFSRHLDTMDLGDPFAATDSIVDILGFIIDGAKIPPGWGILASITDLGTNFIPIPIFKYPESTVSDINQGFTNDK